MLRSSGGGNSSGRKIKFEAFKGVIVYLPMDEDNWAQETPRSSLSVNVEHTQDLQKANPPGQLKNRKRKRESVYMQILFCTAIEC